MQQEIMYEYGHGDKYPKKFVVERTENGTIKKLIPILTQEPQGIKEVLYIGYRRVEGVSSEAVTVGRCGKDPHAKIKRDIQRKHYSKFKSYEDNKKVIEAEIAKVIG